MTSDAGLLDRRVAIWVPIIVALIGFAGMIFASFITAGVVSRNSASSTQETVDVAPTPKVRISSLNWVNDTPEVRVTGQVIELLDGQQLRLFTSRSDEVGGVYPAPDACSASDDGFFTCVSYAGGEGEDGLEFVMTVAITDAKQDDAIRQLLQLKQPYKLRNMIPHVDGVWTTDSFSALRPAPE
jgi:hypothetical protein